MPGFDFPEMIHEGVAGLMPYEHCVDLANVAVALSSWACGTSATPIGSHSLSRIARMLS